jgi:hypothetical protein
VVCTGSLHVILLFPQAKPHETLLLSLQEEIDGFLTERAAAAAAAAAAGDGDASDDAADDEPAPGAKRKRSPAAGAAGQPAKEPRAAADEAGELPGIQLCERSLAFASVDTWKGQKRVNLRLYYNVRV